MDLSANAERIIGSYWLTKDRTGTIIETPEEAIARVCRVVASVEKSPEERLYWFNQFYNLLNERKLMPNSPTWTGAERTGQLMACFVIAMEDSLDSISNATRRIIKIHQSGGGTGMSFSPLRPKNSPVLGGMKNLPNQELNRLKKLDACQGTASGPVSFAEYMVNMGTEVIKQGCFTADTRILTNRGLIPIPEVTLEDLAYTHKGWRHVTDTFQHGKKNFLKVHLANGQVITLTPEHKVAVLVGHNINLVPMNKINVGDKLLLLLGNGFESEAKLLPHTYVISPLEKTTNTKLTFPDILKPELAYVLGYYIGNGSNLPGVGIDVLVPNSQKVVLDNLVTVVEKIFNLTAIITPGYNDCSYLTWYSTILLNWLKTNNLDKVSLDNMRVPEVVFRSNSDVIRAWLAGYFDAVGQGGGAENYYVYNSISEDLLRDTQLLLMSLGIASKLTTECRNPPVKKNIHSLSIIDREFCRRFEIQLLPQSHKLICGPTSIKDGDYHYSNSTVQSLDLPNWATYGFYHTNNPDGLSYSGMIGILDRLLAADNSLSQDVEELLKVLPVKVLSITDAGTREAFDIEVDWVHLLSANGLYASNSVRRGANMGVMDDNHPDIREFITCKSRINDRHSSVLKKIRFGIENNLKKLDTINSQGLQQEVVENVMTQVERGLVNEQMKNFNISVGVSDAFMRAARNNDVWPLIFEGKEYEQDNAGALMDLIAETAWASGEPGLLFLDAANRKHPVPSIGAYTASNPCIAGNTLIYTEEGLQRAEKLKSRTGTPLKVIIDGRESTENLLPASHVVSSGVKSLFCVSTKEGYQVSVTGDHQLMTSKGWVKAKDLKRGDELHILNHAGAFGTEGTYSEGAALESRKYYELLVPECIFCGSKEMQKGFLQALYTEFSRINAVKASDFVVEASDLSVNLASYSYRFLQEVQRLLLNFGIFSVICPDSKPKCMKDINGSGLFVEYPSFNDLVISRDALLIFAQEINFLDEVKAEELQKALVTYPYEYYKTEFIAHCSGLFCDGEKEVFDLSQPDTQSFIANGFVVHNCGEQLLLDNEACDLASIVLSRCVKISPETDEWMVDWAELKRVVRVGIRFLDNVLDASIFPIPEITEAVQKTRRLGLGPMGWSDLLFMLRIPYGSIEAINLGQQIGSFIQGVADDTSRKLAQEKGPYPLWKEGRVGFRRNATLTCVAPTGTIAQVADCSHGIEPLYALSYGKNVVRGGFMQVVHEPFIEDAKQAGVWCDALEQHIMKYGTLRGYEGSLPLWLREVYQTTSDLHWKWHVAMQAAWTAEVDNGCSKTINLPNNATVEDVKQSYTMAWELGCLGITVYRDGSRFEQAIATNTKLISSPETPSEDTVDRIHELICPRATVPILTQDFF